MIDISIIIVLYRSEGNILKLLDSIKKTKNKLRIEIIVVDNAYPDKALSQAKNHSLKPRTIAMKENVGFSKAVNQGISKATGQFILLLNPDTKIIGGCLDKLFKFASSTSNLGAVAPRLINANGKPQASVFRFPTIFNAIRHYFFGCSSCFNKYLPKNLTQKVEVAIMAAFMIPRKVVEKVGKLDERFFLYYEDIEYCRRLKKFNLPIFYLPSARVEHAHGASGRFTSHLESPLARSAEIYYGKFYSQSLNFTLWLGQKWQKLVKLIKG